MKVIYACIIFALIMASIMFIAISFGLQAVGEARIEQKCRDACYEKNLGYEDYDHIKEECLCNEALVVVDIK